MRFAPPGYHFIAEKVETRKDFEETGTDTWKRMPRLAFP